MKVKAWTAFGPNGDLQLKEHEITVSQDQVVVDVLSCSLTRGDVGFIDNRWGSHYPLVAGYEIIGKIRKDFDRNGCHFKAGEVVGLGFQIGACFTCEYCKAGKEQYCQKQMLIPGNGLGGLADVVVADGRFVFALPQNLQVPEATPLVCAGLTVFTPISKVSLLPDMKTGVIGLGSLGHLAVQFLSAMGCDVTAFTHSKAKVEAAKELGAGNVIVDGEAMPSRYFDFIISCASDGVAWEPIIRSLKPEGTLCIVGLPQQPVSFAPELLADLASRRIVGNYVGSRADMRDMLQFASSNNILARTTIYPMNEVNRALADMRASKVDFSAVLVRS